jgi:hypothetical protein
MKKVVILVFLIAAISILAVSVVAVNRRFAYNLSWLPPPGINKLHATFDDATSALQDINAKHMLAYGTALGVTRESELLRHDRDVDFAMFYEDIPDWDTLNGAMAAYGFECSVTSTPYSWECQGQRYPALFQYIHQGTGVGCDIAVLYRHDGGIWDIVGAAGGNGMGYRFSDSEPDRVHFRGHEHLVFPVAWLEEHYGESWRIPMVNSKGRPATKYRNGTSCKFPPPS